MRFPELGKRVGVSVVGIPALIAVILIGKIPFLLFVNFVIAIALWELYGLAEKKGFFPTKSLGMFSILVISWNIYFFHGQWLKEICLAVVVLSLAVELFKGKANALANSAVTLFGIIYLSFFSFYLLIRELPVRADMPYRVGGLLVLFVFVTIWICDTGAYFGGSRFGKNLLFKRISPKKTWEGAVVGFLSGIGATIGQRYLYAPFLSVVDALAIGVIVGVFGQMSDLIESLYKRDAQTKDSSNLIPGHGGILDRFDSQLLVGPIVYFYFVVRGIAV